LKQDNSNEIIAEEDFDYKSIDWKKVYADNRFQKLNPGFVIAIIIICYFVISWINNQTIITWIPNQYISVAFLVVVIVIAILRIREIQTGNRLVDEARIYKKKTYFSYGRGGPRENYNFSINIEKEFTLNANGNIKLSDHPRKSSRKFDVDLWLYNHYHEGDKIILLFYSSGGFICDLQDYIKS
jgi:hypothetical protein